jgi:lambda family phage minor tail protein L
MEISRDELGEIARREVGKSLIDLEHSAIIELFEFFYDIQSEPFRFHAGTNGVDRPIIWNGNKYNPIAVEVEGFEANILGRLPRPKITVANTDSIISTILRDYADFRSSKFVRVRLFLKHLDNENFDGSINPFGNPSALSYISKEKYIFSQKIYENKQSIQFELITPFDIQSLVAPARSIFAKYCSWQYRGAGCNYNGDVICQDDDVDFNVVPNISIKNSNYKQIAENLKWKEGFSYKVGDVVCIHNIDFNGLKDPPYTWFVCAEMHTSSLNNSPQRSKKIWLKDGCSKTIQACKKRFKNVNYTSPVTNALLKNDFDVNGGFLPFGGFPGTDKFRYE